MVLHEQTECIPATKKKIVLTAVIPNGSKASEPLTNGRAFNPLSPDVADLQHFDIGLFCGFSLRNAFCPSADITTVSLLVFPLSLALVMKAG